MFLLNEKLAEVFYAEHEERLERELEVRRALHEMREARLEAKRSHRRDDRGPRSGTPRPPRPGRAQRSAPVTVRVRVGRHPHRRRGMG